MKKKLCRLSLIATGILATGGAITSLTACNKTSVDETVGQVEYLDLSSNATVAIGLKNAGSKIKSITVPETYEGKDVVYIAKGAFADCPNLESITLPFIGKSAGASGTDAMFGYIFGSDMYEGCGGFTWQEADSSETNETVYAQYAIPQNLSTVSITKATNIPAGAFSNCKYLENITINKAEIETIENKAFYCCSSLEKFDLSFSSSLKTIEHEAFEKCYTLASITIPNTVSTIEENAFASCLSATKATVPSSVKTMESGAFSNLGGIVLVEATEEETAGWDSNWTDSDVAVVYDFKSDSSYAYTEDWLVIICGSGNNQYGYLAQWMGNWEQSAVTIPGSITVNNKELPVKVVGGKCFNENYYINRLTIEEGITTIHPNVFEGCTNLEYVTFPSTLTEIRDQAFKNCTALKGRYVDGLPVTGLDFLNVKEIRKQAFYGCKAITDIELENVTTIGDEAFAYCTHLCQENHYDESEEESGLHYILSIPESCTYLGDGAFKWCFKYVPTGYTASYFYPTVWFAHGSTSKLTHVPESCFESCGVRVKTPTSGEDKGTVYPNYVRVNVHLGDAPLTRIENAAFKNCWMYHLKGARNTHLEYIGDYAFYYAQMTSDESEAGGKQDLQMDQEIKYIGEYAFAYCTTIAKLTFNHNSDNGTENYNSLEHLGQYAFYGCNNAGFTSLDLSPCANLKNITVGDTEEKYVASNTPRYAFAQCTHLQTVLLPDKNNSATERKNTTFTRLPERMFEGCTDLGRNGDAVIVPEQITDIRACAFNGCSYLTKCCIDGKINYYGSSIFYNNYELVSVTKSDGTAVEFDPDILTANIGSSIYYQCQKLTTAPIPVGTKTGQSYTLNSSMFYGNKALTSITIPDRIVNIYSSAFWGCTALNTVTFNSTSLLHTISANVFQGCTSLTNLDLSMCSSLYRIYDKAFADMNANVVITLPNRSITFYSKPFEGLTSTATIKFGRKSVVGYTGTKVWDNPDTFKWQGNNTITFTKKGGSGTTADPYYYTCDSDTFGGNSVHFVCYTKTGE